MVSDDDEFFLQNGWPTKDVYILFLAGTIVKDFDHHKSLTRHEQGLNLWDGAVVTRSTPRRRI